MAVPIGESFVTPLRDMPALNETRQSYPVQVWSGTDGAFCVELGYLGGALGMQAWTTREGIERLRDACNVALIRSEA